jgi:autophagy-related protein 33
LESTNQDQGLSYSTASITIPSLAHLPTSTNASRTLHEIKRLNRKHGLRLTSIANICFLFAYAFSPPHRKHPYLLWICVSSTLGSYAADYWFHRSSGFKAWVQSLIYDAGCTSFGAQKKEDDLVVVEAEAEAEADVNGESVRREMDTERRFQRVRALFSGFALAIGIVGLWGDRK